MTLPLNQTQTERHQSGPYRVLVVDDSAVIRGFISRYLEEDPDIKVVASASNGQYALQSLKGSNAEVVVLDIEMPVMDGMTALPKMIEAVPDLKVVMASTLTLKNAEISLKALEMGAADYVPKPETNREVNASVDFRRELVEKVKVYGEALRKQRGVPLPGEGERPASFGGRRTASFQRSPARTPQPTSAANPRPTAVTGGATGVRVRAPISLRGLSSAMPRVLVVASSTGGPQALVKFFSDLPVARRLPVLVVQHMPATFTAILADHIGKASGMPAREARDNDLLTAGQILVAPGDYHMVLERGDAGVRVRLNQGPQENFCRPAADPLFRSAAETFGGNTLGVVLTGMGHDGLKGARGITQAGGSVLVQDEDSSVVWGMPGAVATAGLASFVAPVDELARKVGQLIEGVKA